jgi:hypothetical protein
MKTITFLLFTVLLTHDIRSGEGRPVFETENFKFEMIQSEVSDDNVKLTFLYTNLQKETAWGRGNNLKSGETYLIDQLGERYKCIANENMGEYKTYPPNMPVKMSITFKKSRNSKRAYITFSWDCSIGQNHLLTSVNFENFTLRNQVFD